MEHVRTLTREFETGARAVLHVEARSGAVVVQGGGSDRVVVDALVRVWADDAREADEAADLVGRGMEQDDHRVIVRAPALTSNEGHGILFYLGKRGSRVEYHIRVPDQTAVRVLSRSGSVEVSGARGRVHVEVMSGKLGVSNIKGDVTTVSRSGSVRIDGVQGDVQAEARSGRISVRGVSGSVMLDARSGLIEAEDVGGELRARARTGPIKVENVRGPVHARSRCGPFRYRGRVEGDFDVEVHTGPIVMAVDPERPFFVDAESHIGPVHSDLPPRRGGAEPPAGGPKVRLRTHTGPITISRS